MKKKFIISIALLAIAAVSITAVFAFGLQENKVQHQSECLFGDPSYADGITVTYPLSSAKFASWTLRYNFDGSEFNAEEDFKYTGLSSIQDGAHDAFYKDETIYADDRIDNYTHFTVYQGFDLLNLEDEFREEFKNQNIQGEVTKKVRLKDVREYYMPNVGIRGNKMSTYGMNFDDALISVPEGEPIFWSKFYDYFKIPVIENEVLEVTGVRVNSSSSISCFIHNAPDSEYFEFEGKSILADDALYFTISNRVRNTPEEKYADFSLVPGGYGIYRLPYNKEKDIEVNYTDGVFDIDKLQTVYPLEENLQIRNMGLSTDGSHLYIILGEYGSEGKIIFKSINLRTFTDDQIMLFEDDGYVSVIQQSNFVVLHTVRVDGIEQIKVIYERSAGTYELFLDTVMSSPDSKLWRLYTPTFACDGDRLAVCNCNVKNYSDGYVSQMEVSTGIDIAVYKDNELKYCGTYTNSLDLCNMYRLYIDYGYLRVEDIQLPDDGKPVPGFSHSAALMRYFTEGDGSNGTYNFNLRNNYNRIAVSL